MRILVACGRVDAREALARELFVLGHEVVEAPDSRRVLQQVTERPFHVVFLDDELPGGAFETLSSLRQQHPTVDVMVVARAARTGDAVRAIQAGASNYLSLPIPQDALGGELQRISERRSAARTYAQTRTRTSVPVDKHAMVGRSPSMQRMLQQLERLAPSDATVLVRGESGTGKELVARFIHQRGFRAGRPFVAVNCAALPDNLIESELFGHERGAFTGAVQRRQGRFRQANGGTLFLDEVAELPMASQAKLLRVLQEGEVEPLGGNGMVQVDVRVISATHRNLKERVRSGLFREDLFYRLKVLELSVPPLRERTGDLAPLVEHFLDRFAPVGTTRPVLTSQAWAALADYDFPGNVRELQHAVQHAVVMAGDDDIDLMHLPTDLLEGMSVPVEPDQGFVHLAEAVRGFEASYIERALAATDWNRTKAAALLGISRKNLWEKMKAYGVQPDAS